MPTDVISALGGRKFLLGLLIAGICLFAGRFGHLPMDAAIEYALTAFALFAGGDVMNTWAHRIGAAQEAASNARKVVAQIQAGQNPPTNKLP